MMKLIKETRVFEITQAELDALHALEKRCTRGACPITLDCAICKHDGTNMEPCHSNSFQIASNIEWHIISDTAKLSHLMDVSTIQFRDIPARIVAVLAVNAEDPDTFFNVYYYSQGHLAYSTTTKEGQWFLGYEPLKSTNVYDVINRSTAK